MKLVRDRIPEIIKANGQEPIIRTIETRIETLDALTRNLAEEAGELIAAVNDGGTVEVLDEMCDCLEVLHMIAAVHDLGPDEVETARARKAKGKGAFIEGVLWYGNR